MKFLLNRQSPNSPARFLTTHPNQSLTKQKSHHRYFPHFYTWMIIDFLVSFEVIKKGGGIHSEINRSSYPTFGKRKYLYFQMADSLEVFQPNLREHPSLNVLGMDYRRAPIDPSPKSPSTHRESLAAGPKTTRPQLSMGLCSTTPRSSGCRSANSTVGPVPMERPKRMIPEGVLSGLGLGKPPCFGVFTKGSL